MSFITKRERVFERCDLFDLPGRNEGKLKAYASCTDARAWSHFNSDKTEHLVEIIKRNNEVCRAKYVPTNVIVETLMVGKNAEIARLKRKIEEFELMIAAYDQLELTCEQKCEIGKAHASIREANKELDELAINLDMSNFTEGMDSEGFQTGKSSGDEWTKPAAESKSNQYDPLCCTCDKSTSANATDPRINDMQEVIISKDAKLSAMQNTLAVMKNDVCEPYCIYAHINTALEKIFGILCQNEKYRLYLNLLTTGKDTRCIDIKGKILYKLIVLEKFSLALIAPCSQAWKNDHKESVNSFNDCACFRAEIVSHVQPLSLTSNDNLPSVDNKRAKLVADIMDNPEMKELLEKYSISDEKLLENHPDDTYIIDDYNIETENLNRLKDLQVSYDELMTCYESLKHEKDCLQIRCQNYDELEKELELLHGQVREYNALWNEKEYFRRRSEDLDNLKEQYIVLTEETSNLETQLKAESEINSIKGDTIDNLRSDNIALEKKLNDASIHFEREKNSLQCKLKEFECKVMCQEQQIRSLSAQIDRLLEQDPGKLREDTESKAIELIDEVASLKEQITNLQDALYSNEEEKLQLQERFEDQLKTINDLKIGMEDWKSAYEKVLQHNNYLESITDSYKEEINTLREDNQHLSQDVQEKNTALSNLLNVINNKSQELNNLFTQVESKNEENKSLLNQLQDIRNSQNSFASELEKEKMQVKLARQESQELLEKLKTYSDVINERDTLNKSLAEQYEDCKQLKELLKDTIKENKKLESDLQNKERNNALLLEEIQKLQESNGLAVDSLHNLLEERDNYRNLSELSQRESQDLENKLSEFESLRDQLQNLKKSRDILLNEKNKLESQLREKADDLNNAMQSVALTKKESVELKLKVEKSENLRGDFIKLSEAYHKLVNEKQMFQRELSETNSNLQTMLSQLGSLQDENKDLLSSSKMVSELEKELSKLKEMYNSLLSENNDLQHDYDNKTKELQSVYNTLENKIDENRELAIEIKKLQQNDEHAKKHMDALQGQHVDTKNKLEAAKKESVELLDKIKSYENFEVEFEKLKQLHKQTLQDNERLQNEFNKKNRDFQCLEQENLDLENKSQGLIKQNDNLEKFIHELTGKTPGNEFYENIIKEIAEMKKEKLKSNLKIRELLDKLDYSENIISNMSEELLGRNDKIAVLENHINSLEDEITKLHSRLKEAVDTGEELSDSCDKIDQSLYTMEAHHSKATHNFKMEIAKLQNDNVRLEQQLTVTKKISKDSLTEKHKYASQLIHLQKEREVIVSEIKQLEVDSVGDSKLLPENCSTHDVVHSMERIRTYIQAKNNSLEQTILKVQNSSQLLLSKADEAKRLVEKEKQKIINEKEEAVAARLNMEEQLLKLKEQLEQQSNEDKRIIKNLEAEILNQKLIMNRIDSSTNDYINKLKEELNALQNLYQKSMEKVNELNKKLEDMNKEQETSSETISKLSQTYDEKLKEVVNLKKCLDEMQNKKVDSTGIQVRFEDENEVVATQTDKYPQYTENEPMFSDSNDLKQVDIDNEMTDLNMLKVHIPKEETIKSHLLPSQKRQSVNEVQILTANVEPTLDFVKSCYLNYKLKRLSNGRLEQYSISADNIGSNNGESVDFPSKQNSSKKPGKYAGISNPRLVDIFNRQSIDTNSSKENNSPTSLPKSRHSETKTSIDGTFDDSHKSSSDKSTDKDVFVIYRDSDMNQPLQISHSVTDYQEQGKNIPTKTKQSRSTNKVIYRDSNMNQQPQISDSVTNDQEKGRNIPTKTKQSRLTDKTNQEKDDLYQEAETGMVESKKIRIDISEVPDNISTLSAQAGKHFLQPTSTHGKPKKFPSDGAKYVDVSEFSSSKSDIQDGEPTESHHTLSRVDANFILLNKNGTQVNPENEQGTENFGLEYIMHSVQREMNPDNLKTSGDESQTLSSGSKLISGTISRIMENDIDLNTRNYPKSDDPEVYKRQIQYLTKALKSIEKDYKKKIDAIKMQYDTNIKNIINEHNQGVSSIQCLHEETLQDILKIHENEVENLRSMSIDAMRKSEKLEKENMTLKSKTHECCGCACVEEEPVKTSKRKYRSRNNLKMLTKTNVEAFNVKPKVRSHGPCTCSLDVNISDTIRSLFEQVDSEQRRMSEYTYLKYIANKMFNDNVEALDAQELSFLHLKVCKTWKTKMNKEDALQKKIDSIESDLMNKQRHAQEHIAELDRKVARERRRLQEVREAVCFNPVPIDSQQQSMNTTIPAVSSFDARFPELMITTDIDAAIDQCQCTSVQNFEVGERRSAGDLPVQPGPTRSKRRGGHNKAVSTKIDMDERKEKRLYHDEPPTRLHRAYDRPLRAQKK